MPGNEAANALDGTAAKRWRAPADVKSAWLEVDLGSPKAVGAVGLEEPDVWPRMKQSYLMEAFVNGAWAKVIDGKTNGHGLIKAFQGVTAQKFRFTMSSEKDSPGIAEVQLYGADL